MSSKRKRNTTARFETSSVPAPSSVPTTAIPSSTRNRIVTYTRSSTGRLAEVIDSGEVSLSAEDLAILQKHPEYNIPTQSLRDFEDFVHEDMAQDNDDDVPSHIVGAEPKSRIDPNVSWLPFRDIYLDELLCHDGRQQLSCNRCNDADAEFKCQDCFGPLAFCRECLLAEHACLPLHRIEVRAFRAIYDVES